MTFTLWTVLEIRTKVFKEKFQNYDFWPTSQSISSFVICTFVCFHYLWRVEQNYMFCDMWVALNSGWLKRSHPVSVDQ